MVHPPHALPALASLSPSDAQTLERADPAAQGHFDELRGNTSTGIDAEAHPLTSVWTEFSRHLMTPGTPGLHQRAMALARRIRDNSVSYNVYTDAGGPQRPWSLNLFPLLIEAGSWAQIESGILQRVRLLEQVLKDVYGAQQLLQRGLLPRALVQGHPGYLRAMHGALASTGAHLHLAAFDLARGPDGNWQVVGHRCQAPSGLGYLLENRLAISGQFPQAFDSMRVQRLADTYRVLMDGLRQQCTAGADSHLALLTPGPYNETYFEHAYLARYLGLTLVEGGDLTVRDERLYLKTVKGLVPIHGLLRRVDDAYLDPLELKPDSSLGVPGLLQAIRAGNLLVANAPGAAFLESPALLGFLPALSEHLLGEALLLPSLPTWWCGEPPAMTQALAQLPQLVIKPTYPYSLTRASFEPTLGQSLSPSERQAWTERIVDQPEEHTLQAYVRLSQMPTWSGVGIVARSTMLRVFTVRGANGSWQVLPGGMARVAGSAAEIASMQRGGSSADVWALTDAEVDRTATLVPAQLTRDPLARRRHIVTSRTAENLYWLGRYTERADNMVRVARLTLECLRGEERDSPHLLAWLRKLALDNTLVLPTLASAIHESSCFERSLIAELDGTQGATSIGYCLRALKTAGAAVRERLSLEHWRMIVRVEEDLSARCSEGTTGADHPSTDALHTLAAASDQLAAITGAQSDRMVRDDGWRLLSIGRRIERLGFLTSSMLSGFATGSVHTNGGFDALIELFDSTISFHALYQQSRDLAALIELLVLDQDSPRSLTWVLQTLRAELAGLAASVTGELSRLAHHVPDPSDWSLSSMCEHTPLPGGTIEPDPDPQALARASYFHRLNETLLGCNSAASLVAEEIRLACFSHASETHQSLGAG